MTAYKTIEYYNQNAKFYISDTAEISFSEIQDHFLHMLPSGAQILDFGCGSGRDTKYFLERGFQVEATDGSKELCDYASKLIGSRVKQMLFEDLDCCGVYDGIWACSSILHLSKTELKTVLIKMLHALKPEGIIYTSFKYGDFEGERNGRYFVDFTEEAFARFLEKVPGVYVKEQWISGDVRKNRGGEQWLNLILSR